MVRIHCMTKSKNPRIDMHISRSNEIVIEQIFEKLVLISDESIQVGRNIDTTFNETPFDLSE